MIWLSTKMNNEDSEGEGGLSTIVKDRVKKPPLYKVLLHNDDYTTMEFVIYVLRVVFGRDLPEAQAIMLQVHNEGVGICGVYTFEIGESKVAKVAKLAKDNGHPLLCSMEPE